MSQRVATNQEGPNFKRTSFRKTAAEKRGFQFLHRLPCVISGKTHPIQAAHISYADSMFNKPIKGHNLKADFVYVVPMTQPLHREQERLGEKPFWIKYGFDPDDVLLSPLTFALSLSGFTQIEDEEGAIRFITSHRMRRRMGK